MPLLLLLLLLPLLPTTTTTTTTTTTATATTTIKIHVGEHNITDQGPFLSTSPQGSVPEGKQLKRSTMYLVYCRKRGHGNFMVKKKSKEDEVE